MNSNTDIGNWITKQTLIQVAKAALTIWWILAPVLLALITWNPWALLLVVPLVVFEAWRSTRARKRWIARWGGWEAANAAERFLKGWPATAETVGLSRPKSRIGIVGVLRQARREGLDDAAYGQVQEVPDLLSVQENPDKRTVYELEMLGGQTLKDYAAIEDQLAVIWKANRVKTEAGSKPNTVLISAIWTELLSASVPFPAEDAQTPSDLEDTGLPIGIDEEGEPASIDLTNGHLLIGGITGSGKSGVTTAVLAGLANRDALRIHGIDLKGGLTLWPYLDILDKAATNVTEADELLNCLKDIHQTRLAMLKSVNLQKWTPSKGSPRIVVIIDEAADLFDDTTDKAAYKARVAGWTLLARQSRVTGITLIWATQKPTSDAIPSSITTNAGTRIALRCATREQARAILGDQERNGLNPCDIPADLPGIGILADGRKTKRIRAYHVTEEVRDQITADAVKLEDPIFSGIQINGDSEEAATCPP